MSNVPAGLKYSKEHEWVKVEGNIGIVGITDHAQHALGDIVFVELPKAGSKVTFMKTFGTIESVKAASDLFSPLTGKVVEVNAALADSPDAVNQAPYGDGWMLKVEIANPAELEKLMDDKGYTELLAKS
ncbi:MAG: glycine cleavage system protein GcvH [Planctomycetes bacterium]|nr:glycine cleavage system protein GcvH [Planctomycetota bacterium]